MPVCDEATDAAEPVAGGVLSAVDESINTALLPFRMAAAAAHEDAREAGTGDGGATACIA